MTAYKAMVDYMIKHNYTINDYSVYSQDPEWQKLSKALFEAFAKENNTWLHNSSAKKRRDKYSSIAQWVEQAAVNRWVAGSSPAAGAIVGDRQGSK